MVVFLKVKNTETQRRERTVVKLHVPSHPPSPVHHSPDGQEKGAQKTLALPWLVHFVEGVVVFLSSSLLEFLL